MTMITRLLLFWDTDEVQKFRNTRRHFWIKKHVDERGALGVEEITVDEIRIPSFNNQNSMECHWCFCFLAHMKFDRLNHPKRTLSTNFAAAATSTIPPALGRSSITQKGNESRGSSGFSGEYLIHSLCHRYVCIQMEFYLLKK